MAKYNILIKKSAKKELLRIPKSDVKRIITSINSLKKDPRPLGSKKLTNQEKYRIRQGNYRILYTIDDAIVTVVVVKIVNRKSDTT